ncbi:MAG TPA: delta-60 repeat domain-containing protein [bacterium]|nr:delta-60 repeat domain-containing protein [bacterium]
MKKFLLLFVFIFSLTLSLKAGANPADLDTTFGISGKVVENVGPSDRIFTLAMQSDGKILSGGAASNGVDDDLVLLRFLPTGELDSTFGNGGRVISNFGENEGAVKIFSLPSGKILAVGTAETTNNGNFLLARYNSDGTLDASFGSGGTTVSDLGSFERVISATLYPDGKILVTGAQLGGGVTDVALARYDANGNLDGTFGSGGIVIQDFGGSETAGGVALQSGEKILISGDFSDGGNSDFALFRFEGDGLPDLSFGTDGKVRTDIATIDVESALTVQNDGKLVLVGSAGETDSSGSFAILRYNPDGSLDSGFGTDGKVVTNFGSSALATAVALSSDGKIIVAGFAVMAPPPNPLELNIFVVRYESNGDLDTSFGSDGKAEFNFGTFELANALALQADGKILVAGNQDDDFLVFRLADSGTGGGCQLSKDQAVFTPLSLGLLALSLLSMRALLLKSTQRK